MTTDDLSGRLQAGKYYLAFSGATPLEKAKERFRERYGSEPEVTIQGYGHIFLGPTPPPVSQAPVIAISGTKKGDFLQ